MFPKCQRHSWIKREHPHSIAQSLLEKQFFCKVLLIGYNIDGRYKTSRVLDTFHNRTIASNTKHAETKSIHCERKTRTHYTHTKRRVTGQGGTRNKHRRFDAPGMAQVRRGAPTITISQTLFNDAAWLQKSLCHVIQNPRPPPYTYFVFGVFRDKTNPLDSYNDDPLLERYRFRRAQMCILFRNAHAIVGESWEFWSCL